MRPGPATTLPLLAVAATLVACGTTTIDVAKGERFIHGVVSDQVGARVASVACPDEVEEKEGASFTCRVTGADGSKGDVTVNQEDDGSLQVVAPFLHVREAEAAMAAGIEKQVDADVSVRCPEIIVVRRNRLLACTATSAGKSRDVAVRLTDDAGHFRYRLS